MYLLQKGKRKEHNAVMAFRLEMVMYSTVWWTVCANQLLLWLQEESANLALNDENPVTTFKKNGSTHFSYLKSTTVTQNFRLALLLRL